MDGGRRGMMDGGRCGDSSRELEGVGAGDVLSETEATLALGVEESCLIRRFQLRLGLPEPGREAATRFAMRTLIAPTWEKSHERCSGELHVQKREDLGVCQQNN